MTKRPFTVTPQMQSLMDAARAGFVEDMSLVVEVGKQAANYANRYREDSGASEELSAPPAAYTCPPSHEHGSDRCVVRDRCACEVCNEERVRRADQRRQDALQRHETRPVTTTYTTPTKVAAEDQQQPSRHVRGSRSITSREPVELPASLTHGSDSAYRRHGCRCAQCTRWKSDSNKAYAIRRAEHAAHRTWNPSIDDE